MSNRPLDKQITFWGKILAGDINLDLFRLWEYTKSRKQWNFWESECKPNMMSWIDTKSIYKDMRRKEQRKFKSKGQWSRCQIKEDTWKGRKCFQREGDHLCSDAPMFQNENGVLTVTFDNLEISSYLDTPTKCILMSW